MQSHVEIFSEISIPRNFGTWSKVRGCFHFPCRMIYSFSLTRGRMGSIRRCCNGWPTVISLMYPMTPVFTVSAISCDWLEQNVENILHSLPSENVFSMTVGQTESSRRFFNCVGFLPLKFFLNFSLFFSTFGDFLIFFNPFFRLCRLLFHLRSLFSTLILNFLIIFLIFLTRSSIFPSFFNF